MVNAVVSTTPFTYGFTSYLTNAEYKQAPTGVDVSQLVRGDPGKTEAELANRIAAASSWADIICGQPLQARAVTGEVIRARANRSGELMIVPQQGPLTAVTAFSYGATSNTMSALSDLSAFWLEPQQFLVPLGSALTSTAGPLQFAPGIRPGGEVRCRYSYVAGFPNTTLAATLAAGATSVTVVNATGVVGGQTDLTIYDGAQTEILSVAASYVSGNVLPLDSPALYPHNEVGVGVSALAPAAKQAVTLLTSTLIQTRGAVALIAPAVGGVSARYSQSGAQHGRAQKPVADDNVDLAEQLLIPFMKWR